MSIKKDSKVRATSHECIHMEKSAVKPDIIMEEDAFAHSAGPVHVFFEHLATYTYPIVFTSTLALSVLEFNNARNLYWLLLLMPLGWLAADWITGIIHWFFDTYGSQTMPVLGRSFIKPFRDHHIDPKGITTHSLTVTIGNTCIAAVPITFWILYPLLFGDPTDAYRMTAFFLSFTIGGTVLTNQFHKWSHLDTPPLWIRTLQKGKIILGIVHHDVHHTKPFDTFYCITNGWMNPILDRINFWRGMEKLLGWCGIKPYPGIAEERAINAGVAASR